VVDGRWSVGKGRVQEPGFRSQEQYFPNVDFENFCKCK
jgi:hypothetical protein